MTSAGRLAAVALTASLAVSSASAADYCIDAASGSDSNSGLAPSNCWAGLAPSQSEPFAAGDRVLIAAGQYLHPLTAWYMKPQVSWIGAGREQTIVVYDKRLPNPAPFVRFRTGSGGSGPPSDLRPGSFGPDTVFSDMTLRNVGNASIGIDIEVSSADSSPTVARVAVEGFDIGIRVHPTSDERSAASTGAILTQNVIRDSRDVGVLFFPDVFYARTVTEASTLSNSFVQSEGIGVDLKTFISYTTNFDPADVVLNSVLSHDTVVGGSGSAARLASYLDDGSGERLASEHAGTWGPSLGASIFTGSGGHGIEETSAFTEPAQVAGNALGGNAAGDYRDEGSATVGAASVGTGNLGVAAELVDAAAGDLHVLASSPTIDLVSAAGAPPEDVDSHSRPQGGMADIGADEYVACGAVADTSASSLVQGCAGGQQILDGSNSTVDVVCTAGLDYEWWAGGVLEFTDAVYPIVPDSPATYTLRVRCADPALSACFDETTVDVEPNFPPPSADAGAAGQLCGDAGGTAVFDLSGMASAVPPATIVSTQWSAPEGLIADAGALATTIELSVDPSAKIVPVTLEATDSNGCTAESVVLVTVSPNPIVTIEPVEPACHDAWDMSQAISISAMAEAVPGVLTWDWSSSAGMISGDADALLQLIPPPARATVTVDVVVTDELGCVGSAQVLIEVDTEARPRAGEDLDECRPPGLAAIELDGSLSTAEPGSTWEWTTTAGTIADPGAEVTELILDVSDLTQSATVTLNISTPEGFCTTSDQREITLRMGPTADPGGPYSLVRGGGPTNEIALDGSGSQGGPGRVHAWTTDLGTFLDTGTAASALESPTLVVTDDPMNVQRANVCLTTSLSNGCLSEEVCTTATVLLEPVEPPNDIGWTLRVEKAAPDDVRLSWQDAPEDATHDLADAYRIEASGTACGPFALLATEPRTAGENDWLDPVLASPPPLRFYALVSSNDGGLSDDPAPDGTACP